MIPDGGERLAALARALKTAEEKKLLRELRKGVRAPLTALIPKIQESARQKMPRRGGFRAQFVPSLTVRVQQRNTGRYPGMRIVAKYAGRISRIDRGFLRHPVFADQRKPRDDWEFVTQPVPRGFFTDPIKAEQPDLIRAVEKAMDDVVRQIEIDMTHRRS